MIQIDPEKCLRCSLCIRDCTVKVLHAGPGGIPFVPPELEPFCLNCQHCLAVCPAGALTCHGITPGSCAAPGKMPDPREMFNLLRMRRSCRHYKEENIPAETMAALKSSLAWSPTGCNDHRLFFHIVENKQDMLFFREKTSAMLKFLIKTGIMGLFYPKIKRFLADIMAGEDVIFRNAPHMIIAAVPVNAPCKEADPWIALSYFDLYAQSFGLGTCWCGFAVHAFKWNRAMRKKIALPPGYRIGAVLLFGPPDITYHRATSPANFNL